MAICRVFTMPDGSVAVMRLNPHLAGDLAAETAKNPSLAGLPFIDVDESTIPVDRANRHKWRVQAGAVRVDNSAPDRPDPKQAVKDRIAAATTVADLKIILRDIL